MGENLIEKSENLIEKIDWKKCKNLIPAIIQNKKTGDVLMLGFMNEEALQLTLKTKKVHFFSRTKNRIWMKGETSGDVLNLVDIELDCDNDSLLLFVEPHGNTCHLGTKSCFKKTTNILAMLEDVIDKRIVDLNEESYVVKMHKKGMNKMAQKLGEEAVETVIAALNESNERVVSESADLIFHLLLVLRARGLSFAGVEALLEDRSKRLV